jgi:hypothetical protein
MDNIIFRVHIPNGAGIGNTLKGFISGLTVNPNTKLECNPHYLLGNFDTVLDETYIFIPGKYNDNSYVVEPFSSCRWLILKDEESIQQDLPYEYSNYNAVDLNNPKYSVLFTPKVTIDHYYDRGLIHDKVYNRFMTVIQSIRFKPIIYDELKQYKIIAETSLGISVRTWTASHEYNIQRKYNPELYKNAIVQTLSEQTQINTIVLSIDNDSVGLEQQYTGFLQANYPHINIVIYRECEHDVNHLQYVIIKMLLLSKCGSFIGNRISTFSELVFWFSGCGQKVITVC